MHKHLRRMKADKKDEEKAIKTYGQRQKQIPSLRKMYGEMKRDEMDHKHKLEQNMPLSKYFGGSGEKVMKNMKKEYGDKKGESVFYATANKKKKGIDTGPSHKMKKKHRLH